MAAVESIVPFVTALMVLRIVFEIHHEVKQYIHHDDTPGVIEDFEYS